MNPYNVAISTERFAPIDNSGFASLAQSVSNYALRKRAKQEAQQQKLYADLGSIQESWDVDQQQMFGKRYNDLISMGSELYRGGDVNNADPRMIQFNIKKNELLNDIELSKQQREMWLTNQKALNADNTKYDSKDRIRLDVYRNPTSYLTMVVGRDDSGNPITVGDQLSKYDGNVIKWRANEGSSFNTLNRAYDYESHLKKVGETYKETEWLDKDKLGNPLVKPLPGTKSSYSKRYKGYTKDQMVSWAENMLDANSWDGQQNIKRNTKEISGMSELELQNLAKRAGVTEDMDDNTALGLMIKQNQVEDIMRRNMTKEEMITINGPSNVNVSIGDDRNRETMISTEIYNKAVGSIPNRMREMNLTALPKDRESAFKVAAEELGGTYVPSRGGTPGYVNIPVQFNKPFMILNVDENTRVVPSTGNKPIGQAKGVSESVVVSPSSVGVVWMKSHVVNGKKVSEYVQPGTPGAKIYIRFQGNLLTSSDQLIGEDNKPVNTKAYSSQMSGGMKIKDKYDPDGSNTSMVFFYDIDQPEGQAIVNNMFFGGVSTGINQYNKARKNIGVGDNATLSKPKSTSPNKGILD